MRVAAGHSGEGCFLSRLLIALTEIGGTRPAAMTASAYPIPLGILSYYYLPFRLKLTNTATDPVTSVKHDGQGKNTVEF